MKRKMILVLLSLSGVTQAADLVSCRELTNNDERLACYDQLADNARTPLSTPSTSTSVVTNTDVVKPSASNDDSARFGLKVKADEIEEINSRVLGAFKGWDSKTTFTLENGQVWRVVDGSSASFRAESPNVKVRTGAFGAFYLEIEV